MTSIACPVEDDSVVPGERFALRRGLCAVVCFGLLYGLGHSGLRLAFSDNLSGASALANILAQTLSLGYEERQPPLYEWLLWSVQRVTGPNLVSFLIINYGLLTATFCFLYLAALRLFDDWRWAAVAGLSPLLLYQFGWSVHEGVTHSLVMTCAIAASFWAFMRLVESGRLGDYLLFGALVGLGVISKYGFVAYLIILLACALVQPALRARLFDRRFLASVVIAIAIAAPFGWWLLANNHDLVGVFSDTMAPIASDRLRATIIGIANAIYAPLGFLFPLVVILAVMYPSLWRGGWTACKAALRLRNCASARPNWPLMLLHMTLLGFLTLIAGAALTGASNYLERYMHPFFLLTPLWLLWLVAHNVSAARPKSIGLVLLAVTLAVVPIRALNLARSLGPDCGACRLAVPYEGLAADLKAKGFGVGTLMVMDRNDGGNLRRMFPEARIVLLRRPYYAPAVRPQDLSAPAAIVWRPQHGERLPFQARLAMRQIGGAVIGRPNRVQVPLRALGGESQSQDWSWTTVLAQPSQAPRL
ncbi:MAG: glycosyltransferase family 39 protein [Methyloceanibacter sp.]|nr:glycosyltransferase family 39 protein [Methyloceanibacter sp.]